MKRSDRLEHTIAIRRLLNDVRLTISVLLIVLGWYHQTIDGTNYVGNGAFLFCCLLLIAFVYFDRRELKKLVDQKHDALDREREEREQAERDKREIRNALDHAHGLRGRHGERER